MTIIKATWLTFALLLLGACSQIDSVNVDYDTSVDFDAYRTFAWGPTPETSMEKDSPLMHERTIRIITDTFEAGGLELVQENPDIYVTYHTNAREEVRLHTTNTGGGYYGPYGYDPYWGGMGVGVGTSTTTASTYTKGSLIIDVWDAKTKRAVWRGVAEGTVSEKPEKQKEQIEEAVQRIAATFEKQWAKSKEEAAKAASK